MEKKNSIFAGLKSAAANLAMPALVPAAANPAPAASVLAAVNPAPAPAPAPAAAIPAPAPAPAPAAAIPAPAPAPAPAAFNQGLPAYWSAPRPSILEQEASTLKYKISAMEKNIVSQIERKIGEAIKASVPAAPPPQAAPRPPEINEQLLLKKISDLDRRLEDFGRSAATSTVQAKSIEESRLSARREMEDLLKVVREQQKGTEMDREMHDQLSKSWNRAEELEKKLIGFCGAVLNNQQNIKTPVDPVRPEREHRMADIGGFQLADLKKEMTAELVKTREATLALSREQAVFFKNMFEEQVKGRLELIQSLVAAELERNRKETSAEFDKSRMETAAEFERSRVETASELERNRKQTVTDLEQSRKETNADLEKTRKEAAADLEKSRRETVTELERSRKETAVELERSRKEMSAELEKSRKETNVETELLKKEFSAQIKALQFMIENFGRGLQEKLAGTEAAVASVARSAADSAVQLPPKFERMAEIIGHENDKLLHGMQEKLAGAEAAVASVAKNAADSSAQLQHKFERLAELIGRENEKLLHGVKDNLAGTEAAVASVSRNAADSSAQLQHKSERLIEVIRQESSRSLSELEERDRKHFEALNTKYADALSNAAALDFISASADVFVKKMAALEETLAGLISQADQERVSAGMGVSGMLVRKNFEAMELLLTEIRQDAAGLERIKKEAGEKLKSVFREERK